MLDQHLERIPHTSGKDEVFYCKPLDRCFPFPLSLLPHRYVVQDPQPKEKLVLRYQTGESKTPLLTAVNQGAILIMDNHLRG